MIRGLYTAAGGMMVQVVRQETISNNLANVETSGFKHELDLQRAYQETNILQVPRSRQQRQLIGRMELGAVVDSMHTNFAPGSLVETNRSLDLAITGDGFFVIETPQGRRYTRSGAFTLDAQRYLVTEQGYRVVGSQGSLQLPAGEVQITAEGRIFVNNQAVGQLELVSFSDLQALRKEGSALWAAPGQEGAAFGGQVQQGYLEASNVQIAEEMGRMLTALRLYETNQRVLQAQDQLTGKAVTEIGAL